MPDVRLTALLPHAKGSDLSPCALHVWRLQLEESDEESKRATAEEGDGEEGQGKTKTKPKRLHQPTSKEEAGFMQQAKRRFGSLQQSLVNFEEQVDLSQKVLNAGGGPEEALEVYGTHFRANQGRMVSFYVSQQDEVHMLASPGADVAAIMARAQPLLDFVKDALPSRLPTAGQGGSSASSSKAVVFCDGQNRIEVLAVPANEAYDIVTLFLEDFGPILDAAEPVPISTSAGGGLEDAGESTAEGLEDALGGVQPEP